MPDAKFHQALRAITRGYPLRTPSYELNWLFERFLTEPTPLWLRAEAYKNAPLMELNVSDRFQRKIYYFPVAYARFWLSTRFAGFLRDTLRPGDMFMDVGANIGYYTLLAASLVGPAGRVLAFEPEPGAFESLTRSVLANEYQQVTCVNMALSNQEGTLQLFRARDTANSLVAATSKEFQFKDTIDIQATTLDNYLTNNNLSCERLRGLKVDVEGNEAQTMEGMLGSLQRFGYPQIWAEVRGPKGSKRAPDTFAATLKVLQPLGYRAYRWRRGATSEVSVADVQGREDILFSLPQIS